MTFPLHYTKEQRSEARKQYRLKNRSRFLAYDRKRQAKRVIAKHYKTFEGKSCQNCGIALTTPIYGAKGTKVHCHSCAMNKKELNRINMRKWRKAWREIQKEAKKTKSQIAVPSSLYTPLRYKKTLYG